MENPHFIEVLQAYENLIYNFGNMLVLKELILLAQLFEVERHVLQNNWETLVLVQVVGGEDIVDFDNVVVLDPPDYHDFPQRAQGQDPIRKYGFVSLDGIDLLSFLLPDLINLSVGARAQKPQTFIPRAQPVVS